MNRILDVVVIGAGMAGLSAGAELAGTRSVAVLEQEPAPAQHATGRSAAMYIERYGGPAVAPFNRASHAWFITAGEGAVDHPLLGPRGILVVAAPGSTPGLEYRAEAGAHDLAPAEAMQRFPALRPEAIGSAVYVPGAADLDAAGAVVAYRRRLKERGGRLITSARVTGLIRGDGAWDVVTAAGTWRAASVVDAAGAWADDVAALAGLPRIGLQPARRTICVFAGPADSDHRAWPMLVDADERFYLKPEAGGFLASPADETPQVPGDARPDMLDIATALERVREVTTLEARSVTASWAGLRTFAPDRCLVLGPDPVEPSFVWCAGQGGFGIQSGPAAARGLVSLMDDGTLPPDVVELGGDAAAVRPDRFRR